MVKEGVSKEGLFKQTFKYEKNLPCADIVVRITPSRKTSPGPKEEMSLV